MDSSHNAEAEVSLQFDAHESGIRKLFSIFNPTQAWCTVRSTDGALPPLEKPYSLWTARDNRKGRHTLVVPGKSTTVIWAHGVQTSPWRAVLHKILHSILKMATVYPLWDISYDVAILYTLGSLVWVLNGFFSFLPLADPSTGFKNEILWAGGISAIFGGIVFEVASVLLLLEAANENREDCFGWAVKMLLTESGSHPRGSIDLESEKLIGWEVEQEKGQCRHHQANKSNLVGRGQGPLDPQPGAWNELIATAGKESTAEVQGKRLWTWWPSIHEIISHQIYSLGFLGALIQLVASTVFCIPCVSGCPGIYDHMSPGLTLGVYWIPQIVGGVGFLISSILFMLETQSRW